MTDKLQTKIDVTINKLPCPSRMCYSVCLDLVRRIGKSMDEFSFVKGEGHYWLEDKDGKVVDPYADILYYSYDYKNIETGRVQVKDIRSHITKDECTYWDENNERKCFGYRFDENAVQWNEK